MRLTKSLNVSNECYDYEVLEIMENLEIEIRHFEVEYENKDHPLSHSGLVLNCHPETKMASPYRTLFLRGPSLNSSPSIDVKSLSNLIFMGVVYEMRFVRIVEKPNNNDITKKFPFLGMEGPGEDGPCQKILNRSLFIKCLCGEEGMLYFLACSQDRDFQEVETIFEEPLVKFFDNNFVVISAEDDKEKTKKVKKRK